MQIRSFSRGLLLGACSMALIAPAHAQDADTVASEDDGIVVTAQNRTQNVNDVPIAINVVSAEELRATGFAGMNDSTRSRLKFTQPGSGHG